MFRGGDSAVSCVSLMMLCIILQEKYTTVMVQSGFKQCFSNGLSWLFLLGCLNLFLTTQLNHDSNIHKSRHRTPPPVTSVFIDGNPGSRKITSDGAKNLEETKGIY